MNKYAVIVDRHNGKTWVREAHKDMHASSAGVALRRLFGPYGIKQPKFGEALNIKIKKYKAA